MNNNQNTQLNHRDPYLSQGSIPPSNAFIQSAPKSHPTSNSESIFKNVWLLMGMCFPFVLAGIILLFIWIFPKHDSGEIALRSEEWLYETGDPVSISLETLLDTELMSEEMLQNIRIEGDLFENKSKFTTDSEGIVRNVDLKYLESGEYTLKISLNKRKEAVKILVMDTQSPLGIGLADQITIAQGAEFNPQDYFLFEDYSQINLSCDLSNTSSLSSGLYPAMIKAMDEEGNESEHAFTLKVASLEAIKEGEVLTERLNGTVPVPDSLLKMAKSGDVLIYTDLADSQATTKIKTPESKRDKILSYDPSKITDSGYSWNKFTNSVYGSYTDSGLSYKKYREMVNSNGQTTADPQANSFDSNTGNFQSLSKPPIPDKTYATEDEAHHSAMSFLESDQGRASGKTKYYITWEQGSNGQTVYKVTYD